MRGPKSRYAVVHQAIETRIDKWSVRARGKAVAKSVLSMVPFWPESKPVAIGLGLAVCAWFLYSLSVPVIAIVIAPTVAFRFVRDRVAVATWTPFVFCGYVLTLWVLSGFNAGNPLAWANLWDVWFANEPISLWIPILTCLALPSWLGPTRSGAAFIEERYPRAKLRDFYLSAAVCVALILGIDVTLGLNSFQARSLCAVGILFAMSLVSRFTNLMKSDARKQAVAEVKETVEVSATARLASVAQTPVARPSRATESSDIPDIPLRVREGALAVFDTDEPESDQVAIPGSLVEGKNGLSYNSLMAIRHGQDVRPGEVDRFAILRRILNGASSLARVSIPILRSSDAAAADVAVVVPQPPVEVAEMRPPIEDPDPVSPSVSREPTAPRPAFVPPRAQEEVVPPSASTDRNSPIIGPFETAVAAEEKSAALRVVPVDDRLRESSVPFDPVDVPEMRRVMPLEDPEDDVSDSDLLDHVEPIPLGSVSDDSGIEDYRPGEQAGTTASWLMDDEPVFSTPVSTPAVEQQEPVPEVLDIEIGESEPMAMESLDDDPFGSPPKPPAGGSEAVAASTELGVIPVTPVLPPRAAEPASSPSPARDLRQPIVSPAETVTASPAAAVAAVVSETGQVVRPTQDAEARRVRGVAIRMVAAYTNMLSKGLSFDEVANQVLSKITPGHLEVMATLIGGEAVVEAYRRYHNPVSVPEEGEAEAAVTGPTENPVPDAVPAEVASVDAPLVEAPSVDQDPPALPSAMAVESEGRSDEESSPSQPVTDGDQAGTEHSSGDAAVEAVAIPDGEDQQADADLPPSANDEPAAEAVTIAAVMASRDSVPSVTPADRAPPPMMAGLPAFDMSSTVIAPRGTPAAAATPGASVADPEPAEESDTVVSMTDEHREALAFIETWLSLSGSTTSDLEAFFAQDKRPFPDDMELSFLVRRLSEFEPSQASARRLEASLVDVIGRPAGQLQDPQSLAVIKGLYACIPSEMYDRERWRFRSRDQMFARLGLFFRAKFAVDLTGNLKSWLHDSIKTKDDIALAKSYIPAVEILLKAYHDREEELPQLNAAIDLAEYNLAQASASVPSLVHEGLDSAGDSDGIQARMYARSRLVGGTLPSATQDAILHFLNLASAIDVIDMTVKRESLKNRSSIETHALYPALTELEFRAVEIIDDIKINLVKRDKMLAQIPDVISGRNEDAGVLFIRLAANGPSIVQAYKVQRERLLRAATSVERIAELEGQVAQRIEETDQLRAQMKDRIVTDTVTGLARALSEREPALKIVDRKGPAKLRAEIGRDTEVAVVILHGGDVKWTVMSGTKLEAIGIRGSKVQTIDLVAMREWVRNSHPFGSVPNLRLRIVLDTGDLSGSLCDYVFSRRDISENPSKLLDESEFDSMS